MQLKLDSDWCRQTCHSFWLCAGHVREDVTSVLDLNCFLLFAYCSEKRESKAKVKGQTGTQTPPRQSAWFLTWYDFMEAVAVSEVILALKLLRALAQRPTVHVCLVVFHQRLLKESSRSFVVAFIVQLHCRCEGALRQEVITKTKTISAI